ncbi:hypothetical protein N7G274_010528 [Stereocaulon virgatum]|uniref:Uncharacterized protein n=1 Tax=Stereocaulon virgatum TaxID=373712 RepID=A0ABR3ZU40_9LECA
MRKYPAPTVPDNPPKLPPLSRSRPLSYPEPHEPVSPLGPEPIKHNAPVSPLTSPDSLPFAPTPRLAQSQSQQTPVDHSEPYYPTHRAAGAEDSYYPEEPFTIPHKEASTKHTMYWHPIRQPTQPPQQPLPSQLAPAKTTTPVTRKPLPPQQQPQSTGYPSIQPLPAQARPHRPRHKQSPYEMPLPREGARKKVEWDAANLMEAQRRDQSVRREDARNCRRCSLGVLALLFMGAVIFGVVYALVKKNGTS